MVLDEPFCIDERAGTGSMDEVAWIGFRADAERGVNTVTAYLLQQFQLLTFCNWCGLAPSAMR
jgi:hypothetical protein